ncbi:MAG: hypothetical protein A2722_03405 [Candidatus Doudnabacteria bacterium RIFCSPHIGHO2_01_FULL_50_11]|uniref:Uncharacterized protein n=1 Tax=Candidatus Doudnabacteria bacterium RIFCSPHIGHO2_01_FULL_50_11 TaxID=1817828 RepID=A0A1F5PID7_9BACT|nr:MAG: hypothetical protein A2722_03405 [Candidatus Doudnabacteria bacterium RIFCSPHIGHO2_01_FULL_50_11]HLC44291.1 F0F1 ATP synthase subunit delta [Patescibacteria group bacterium]
MKITPQQYAAALYDALSTTRPSDHDRVIENFLQVLREHGTLSLHPEIERAFLEYESKQKGEIATTVTTAREEAPRHLIERLNEIVGGNAVIRKEIDESLLGGVLIETEDTRIDASVKTQLRKLKDSLSE